ncbi:MAG: hypothetical protein A3I39_02445 [Candidatus Yanofskybacteria bacterium RIFCSPLOWO2_02_FULL_47_9b]|uniref:Uncharacterized protein n=1 Tax=Candidatus Yanofskybacteria bacterium RIFCSPLOWO2_02_FULL_47_9b TaxID=1802708 RepID=A0A1F8H548_9BACT|nr:MAG: hypothetical protein A3I39_02445 [Candidatus Yanofskybacteria bacterium RIFCSPLOWO2_02_FULL_47_9b]
MKAKKLIILFCLIALAAPIFVYAAPSYWPIVPCGINRPTAEQIQTGAKLLADSYYQPCNQCTLIQLFKNLIDLVVQGLVPILGTFFFLVGGFMILLGNAKPDFIQKGKSIMWDTAIGIAIILSSYLITNFILKSLAGNSDIATKWNVITCQVSTLKEITDVTFPTVGGGQPGPTPAPASGSIAKAQELISAIGLNSFSSNGDCGSNFNANRNIQDIAGGKFPAVCSPSCSCVTGGSSGNVTVNASLLDGLTKLNKKGIKFTVTSLTTGKHSQNSSHYKGNGVDIVINPSSPSVWIEAKIFLNGLGGQAVCEDKNGQVDADCSPIPSVVDHIHWTR